MVYAVDGGKWQIDDFTVRRTPDTTLLQKRGLVEVGAWVRVSGLSYGTYIAAQVIEVLRPAGAPPPAYEYTGRLEKQGTTFWIVGDTHILVTDRTDLKGNLVPGSLVRATVRRAGHEWEAQEIKEIAADAETVPVVVEGKIDQISDTSWVVDSTRVVVPEAEKLPVDQGDDVEVAAVDEGGTLVAQQVQVVGKSLPTIKGYVVDVAGQGEDNQTWSIVTFDGGQSVVQTVQVTPETYVDEDRATVLTGLEAQVQGDRTDGGAPKAALIRLDQPLPGSAQGALMSGRADGTWLVGGQRVWFGSDPLKQQAVAAAGMTAQAAGQAGTTGGAVLVRGVRLSNGVLVAKQVSKAGASLPAGLEAETAGASAASAVDWFGPNFINPVGNTSSKPTVLFDAKGGGHAVYESLGTIYYSYLQPGRSWSEARKIGTGVTPTAVLDARGLVHVAFRGEFLKNYDIMHVRQLPTGGWTLPVIVAPTTGASADPALAADSQGRVYVAWMDKTSGSWAVQLGTWDGRYWTTYPIYYGQGQSPALAVLPNDAVFLAWQDRVATPGNLFGSFEIFASERPGPAQFSTLPTIVSDAGKPTAVDSIGVHLTTTSDGLVHMVWVDGGRQVRYLFAQTDYWPVPVNLGPARSHVRGVSVEKGSDGLLYVALDEGESVSVAAAAPRTVDWPDAQLIASRTAPTEPVSDVSVTASADRVAVTWLQTGDLSSGGIYESRHQTARQVLKIYIPMVLGK